MKRMLLLALAAAVIPACGMDGREFETNLTLPDPVLLSDEFSDGLEDWTVMSPTVTVDSAVGTPSPSMGVSAGGRSASAAARTLKWFNPNVGIGLWVWVDVLPGNSNGSINIISSVNPASINTYASITKGSALLSVAGQTKAVTFAPDSVFHRWLFLVIDGKGSWWRDDTLLFAFPYGEPMVKVELMDLPYGVGTHFDNVVVTH